MREVLDMVETPTNRWPEPTMVADDDAAPQGAGGQVVVARVLWSLTIRCPPSWATPSPPAATARATGSSSSSSAGRTRRSPTTEGALSQPSPALALSLARPPPRNPSRPRTGPICHCLPLTPTRRLPTCSGCFGKCPLLRRPRDTADARRFSSGPPAAGSPQGRGSDRRRSAVCLGPVRAHVGP